MSNKPKRGACHTEYKVHRAPHGVGEAQYHNIEEENLSEDNEEPGGENARPARPVIDYPHVGEIPVRQADTIPA